MVPWRLVLFASTMKRDRLMESIGSLLLLFPAGRRPKRESLYKPAKSATEALRKDWERLGGDMRKAVKKVTDVKK
jgi:hypothetical protein